MKSKILLLGLLTAGCQAEMPPERIRASFQTLQVKALDNDSAVQSLDLLVFRNGQLDAYARVLGSDVIEAEVSAGAELDWYVIANAPEGLGEFRSESAFLETPFTFTECPIPMHASGKDVFLDGENHLSGIILQRYACMVTLEEVEVSWLSAFSHAPPCRLEGIGLLDARLRMLWSGAALPAADGDWENRIEPYSQELTDAEPVELGARFYSLPNPSANRPTRLALKLGIDGVTQWYVTPLPPMEANTHYCFSRIIVTGPGSPGPEFPLERHDLLSSVYVQPWDNAQEPIVFPNPE